MLPYESMYVELLGTIVLLIQSTLVLLHQVTNLSNYDDFQSFPPYVIRHLVVLNILGYTRLIINKLNMRVAKADIMAMKYVELIQAQIVFNMRNLFLQNVSFFRRCRKCVVAKCVRFPKATIIESSRSRTCFWCDVLDWNLVFNCIKISPSRQTMW